MSTASLLRHHFAEQGNELAVRLTTLSITIIQSLHNGGIATLEQLRTVPEAHLRQHPFMFGDGEIAGIYTALEDAKI